ncbi:MAG TPA: hypothetical protein VFX59_01370 [Polyangiales bacterium]|nr:hypothetical protein [Polyangiales bacterium]
MHEAGARRRLFAAFIVVACCALAQVARAHPVERVVIEGLNRTHEDTVTALLPRAPPSDYDDAELDDLARRLANLAIFDSTFVEREGTTLHVKVREKWTLIPDFALATGKTASDLFIALGATEYNFLGRASELSVSAYREQRGLGFSLGLTEHEYRQRRWSYAGTASYGSASTRYEGGESWFTTGTQLGAWVNSVPVLRSCFRYQVSLLYMSERIEDVEGVVSPPSGHSLQIQMWLIYDRYRWHDLVPSGVKVMFNAGPGLFVPAMQPRHFTELTILGALPLGRYGVLTARLVAGVGARGNPNSSFLIGSIEGVRGLDDSLYRNWAQSMINVEFRQALPILDRVALQVVAFADAAAFERMKPSGARGEGIIASSVGAGLRIVPTFLATFVARFDMARLLAPDSLWFPQVGVAQYF